MGPLLALGGLAVGLIRISAREAVASPVRQRLVAALAAGELLSTTELARLAGISRKTTAYHLRILVRVGLAAQRGHAARPLFSRAGTAPDASARALRHPNRRALWDAAVAHPGATLHELARASGLKPGTAYFHAQVLLRAGLLEVADFGGLRTYAAARPLGDPQDAPPAEPGAPAPA